MEQHQYREMSEIMMDCMSFMNDVQKRMMDNGLFQNGYNILFFVGPVSESDDSFCRVTLAQFDGMVTEQQRIKNMMEYWKDSEWKWRVQNDPVAEKGPVQPTAESSGADVQTGKREDPGKSDPLDGLWISSSDNDPSMDGGQ